MMTEDRTRFEVLLEDVQTKLKVIAEGQGAVDQRLEKIEGRLGGLETRFDKLEIRFDVLEHRFNRIEHRFDEFASDTELLVITFSRLARSNRERTCRD